MLDKDQDYCVYCSVKFGTKVVYKKKLRVLFKIEEHFYPRVAGGKQRDNLMYACQVCNLIKLGLVFDTRTDAKNYIWDRLLDSDWMIVESEIEST